MATPPIRKREGTEWGSDTVADRPKRPLSAYNIFFREERRRMLLEIPHGGKGGNKMHSKRTRRHGKFGFEELARAVSLKWKETTKEERYVFEKIAAKDRLRYNREMDAWKKDQVKVENEQHQQNELRKDTKVNEVLSVSSASISSHVRKPQDEPLASNDNTKSLIELTKLLLKSAQDSMKPESVEHPLPSNATTLVAEKELRFNLDSSNFEVASPHLWEGANVQRTLLNENIKDYLAPSLTPHGTSSYSWLAGHLGVECVNAFIDMFL